MRLLLLLAALAIPLGCSSKQGTSAGGGGGLAGIPQNQSDGGGVLYPTANIGTAQRGVVGGKPGATPGNVIQNFKFLGYPGADSSKGLQTIALSDFYDPAASRHKILHIIGSATWCADCISEMSALSSDLAAPATDFASQGVAYLGILIEGSANNIGATHADLDVWIGKEHPAFTQALDPEAGQLGVFFDATQVPLNLDIDVRTMEVLQAGTGAAQDPKSVVVWLDWVSNNPPSYKTP